MDATSKVKLSDLVDALDWVSADGAFDNAAYISRQTGQIHWESAGDELEEDLPPDVADESLHASMPSRRDLDLGRRLVFAFVESQAPALRDEVRDCFSRRGAYARFKDLLDRSGLLQAWYNHEQKAVEEALLEWAASEGFEVDR